MEIPDTVYIPTLEYRLQYLKKIDQLQGLIDHDQQFIIGFKVDEDFSTLQYNGDKHCITICHIPLGQVPAMLINLSTASYQAFCTEINKVFHCPKNKTCTFPTGSLIKDDESAIFAQIH